MTRAATPSGQFSLKSRKQTFSDTMYMCQKPGGRRVLERRADKRSIVERSHAQRVVGSFSHAIRDRQRQQPADTINSKTRVGGSGTAIVELAPELPPTVCPKCARQRLKSADVYVVQGRARRTRHAGTKSCSRAVRRVVRASR